MYVVRQAIDTVRDIVSSDPDADKSQSLKYEVVVLALSLGESLDIPPHFKQRLEEPQFDRTSTTYYYLDDLLSEAKAIEFGEKLRSKLAKTEVDALSGTEVLQISNRSIVEVHNGLSSLRRAVETADLSDTKRDKLKDLLNDFERLLNSRTPRKATLLQTFAFLAAGIGGSTAFLADAPAAMTTLGEIATTIGEEIMNAEKAKRITQEIAPVAIESKPKPVQDSE